jgi:hypothetical protein
MQGLLQGKQFWLIPLSKKAVLQGQVESSGLYSLLLVGLQDVHLFLFNEQF